ncbi:MAG: MobQ family relaxase [Alphaproteobacteria bacterium]|nr:MobQ family relaxase [Alphaproteobacteria bacterium]
MAIYHCSLRVFSRAENHSAVAAAAYRSGQKLVDERTGTIHRYEKRHGVVNAFILMPLCAPERFHDRFVLWNASEEAETRKNSRVAREVIIALPYELNTQQRESLTRDMAAYLVEKYRVAVDVAIHSPCEGDGHDPRNHHAHLLFTTRELTPEGLGAKTRILDDKITGPQQIEIIREVWETLSNDALSRAGRSDVSIDRRTLEAQGIERIPQIHEGKASNYAEDLRERRHDTQEDDDDEGDGEDGDTDTDKSKGGKSGSGDTGRLSPDMSPKEDLAEKLTPEEKIETREKSRSEFNAEIKALNEKRAEYPDTPFNAQIKNIEQEIDALDRRVERLETLLDKTTLPQKLQKLIGDIATKAREFLVLRTEGQIKRELSQSEREERHARQLARYGKIYRESIHSQMGEMKDKIETLQSRETEYKKYQMFISHIEVQLQELKSGAGYNTLPGKRGQGSENGSSANAASGDAQRGQTKQTPQAKETSVQNNQKVALADMFKKSGEQEAVEHKNPLNTPEAANSTKGNAPERNIKTNHLPSKNTKGSPIQDISDKTSIKTDDWRIDPNQRTKEILGKIHEELREVKVREKSQKQAPEDLGNLKGEFANPKAEEKRTSTEDALNKVKKEAERKRENIPPEYRAAPYPPSGDGANKASRPKPDANSKGSFKDAISKIWKRSDRAKTTAPDSSPKMSSAFNQASGESSKNQKTGFGWKPSPET